MFLQQVRRLQALLHRCEEFASNPEILEPTVELDEVNQSGGEDFSPFEYVTLGPQSCLQTKFSNFQPRTDLYVSNLPLFSPFFWVEDGLCIWLGKK